VLEIIEKCTEAKSSEVKSQKWSENLSNIKCSEVKEEKWSGMRWSEVQYREGGEWVFVEKVYRIVSDEKWRTGVKACVN